MIVTYASGIGPAAQATATIPIVQAAGPDLVALGLAKSFARPGGNVTGVSFFVSELAAKRLELLRELNPAIARVGLLMLGGNLSNDLTLELTGKAAAALGMNLRPSIVHWPGEFEATLSAWRVAGIQAGLESPLFVAGTNAERLSAIAIRQGLPLSSSIDMCRNGGLLGFGVDIQALFYRAADFVDRILKGAKPGDLPIEQPTRFQYMVNMKTAKALGLAIPPSILARADEVIE
jgi:putative ABC transport system substrate-binding protein